MKRLNKKGFTLVELLAVIVVLALLMVVAANSVGTALDNSKKKTLQTEAQKVLTNFLAEAQSTYLVDSTATTPTTGKKTDGDYTYSIVGAIGTDGIVKITSYCVIYQNYSVGGSSLNITTGNLPTFDVKKSGTTGACTINASTGAITIS